MDFGRFKIGHYHIGYSMLFDDDIITYCVFKVSYVFEPPHWKYYILDEEEVAGYLI